MFVATQELSLNGKTYFTGDEVEKPTARMIDGGLVREYKPIKTEILTEVSDPVDVQVCEIPDVLKAAMEEAEAEEEKGEDE